MTKRNSTGAPKLNQDKVMKFSDFMKKARKVHGDTYSYLEHTYTKCSAKLTVICSKHGEFYPTGNNHLCGSGCRKCVDESKIMGIKEFISKASKIHNGKYKYASTAISGSKSKVLITCSVHGEFEQEVRMHLQGKGCPKCGAHSRGWSRTSFQKACNRHTNGEGTLYVLRCYNDEEEFYKVGLTSRSIRKRYDYRGLMPYSYEVVYAIKQNGTYIFNLESSLKKILYEEHYLPKIPFGGHQTECFTTIKPIEQLLKRLTSTEQLQLLA